MAIGTEVFVMEEVMTVRYDPIGKMKASHNGLFVYYAEYDELTLELIESAVHCFNRIQRGEISADDATTELRVLVTLLRS